jgi:hypothetical protein
VIKKFSFREEDEENEESESAEEFSDEEINEIPRSK